MVLLLPVSAFGDEDGSTPLAEAASYFRSNFGVAFKQVTVEISDSESLKTLATLEGDLVVWPYLSFQSPTRFFGESSFGWLMEYGLTGFNIDKQSEPFSMDEATDMGTSAKGWFLFAMPTLTWNPVTDFRAGVGLGGGFMSLKGDALLYDPFPTVSRIDYDFGELTWGMYLLFEYLFGDFMVGAHAGGLYAEKSPYEYSVIEASMIFSYHKRW
jgi:hypothetical protein